MSRVAAAGCLKLSQEQATFIAFASGAVATLGANLKSLQVLSANEKNLLREWLNRISAST
ncbi:hypothetical protein [Leptospira idonii]|uniref:Uncharacterized protein n=1 Tax=Leptospira idonii TaxID=1193500 RepID=A0A4R9M963_9LEPT|nr:hypothetical protein [Leptospira idonii]TGN21028.1 hypothetical protein EHS15_00475 [Leptospira idonii]